MSKASCLVVARVLNQGRAEMKAIRCLRDDIGELEIVCGHSADQSQRQWLVSL